MLNFKVDDSLCTRCKECARDCPSRVIRLPKGQVPVLTDEAEENCIRCQHCLAICPTGAISILDKRPEDSSPIDPDSMPSLDSIELLVKGRRTTRRYKKQDMNAELINRLLDAAAHAPTGANRRALTFSVIDNTESMNKVRNAVMEALREASEKGTIPEHFAYLHAAVPAFFKYGADLVFRGAPHMLIVSADSNALCPNQDIAIALSTFETLAASAGAGTTWCGMLNMALECVPDLKSIFELSESDPYYAMLFGIPNVTYARTVQRSHDTDIKRIAR